MVKKKKENVDPNFPIQILRKSIGNNGGKRERKMKKKIIQASERNFSTYSWNEKI